MVKIPNSLNLSTITDISTILESDIIAVLSPATTPSAHNTDLVVVNTKPSTSALRKENNISAEVKYTITQVYYFCCVNNQIVYQELETIIRNRTRNAIFEEYAAINCLSNSKRKLLVATVVTIMVERNGFDVPVFIKEEFPKCIVQMLPLLKDRHGKTGYACVW